MATKYWIGGSSGNTTNDTAFASASNWSGNSLPTDQDTIIFDSTANADCHISTDTIPGQATHSFDEVKIEANFDQEILFVDVNANLKTKKLTVKNASGKINATGGFITFYGAGVSGVYIHHDFAPTPQYGIFKNSLTLEKLAFDFKRVNGSTGIKLENGVYPSILLTQQTNNSVTFSPVAVTPAGTNNFTYSEISAFATDETCIVTPSSKTAADFNKHFKFTGVINAQTHVFDWGNTTVEITPTEAGGSEMPFNGNYITTGNHRWGNTTTKQFQSKFHKLIIAANTGKYFKLSEGAILTCNKLVIQPEGRLYGPDTTKNRGAEIHCIDKPTLHGDWNFSQVAEGIYRSRNNPPAHQDYHTALTKLKDLGTNGQVLALDSSGNFEWSSTAGGGGLDAIDVENTDSGYTWGTSDVSSISTLKIVAGANVTLASDTSAKAIRITSTDTNTTTTADVLSALNADWGGNKTFGTDVADTATFSGPITAGYIDGLNGLRSSKISTNTSGDNTTYAIGANVSQHSGSTVTGISRLQGIYITNLSGNANHSGEIYQHGIKIVMTGTAAGQSENRGIEISSSGADKNYGLIVANAVTSGFGITSPDITSIAEFQRDAKAIVKLTSTDTNNSSNSSDTVLEMKTGHASAVNQIVFSDPDASAAGKFNYLHTSNRFLFEIGGSGIASIDANGIAGNWAGNTIPVAKGGTGQTSYTNGQLLIGNTTGNTLAKGTLSAGDNITITNGAGSIEIAGTANDDVSVDNLKDRLNDGFAGNAVTIGDGDDVVTIGNDLTVSGDLIVNGTTTTVNSTTLTTADCLISLATGQTANGADALDIGFYGTYNDGSDSNTQKWRGFYYDKSGSKWKLFTGLTQEPTTTVSTDNANHGFVLDSLKLLNLEATGTITGDVTGDLTGNADTATNASNASNVGIVEDNSTDASFYPSFVNGTSGNKPHKVDSGLTYNPSTGMLTAAGFTGTLTGNASGLSSTLAVASGGTGATSLTSNAVLTGNGTNAIVAESNMTFTGGTLTVKGNKSNEEAILKVRPVDTNSRDAVLAVEGARNASTTANTAMIKLQNRDDNAAGDNLVNNLGAIVGRVTDHSDNHGDMHFITYSDGATASETMTLTGGGKVGIGNTSPNFPLHLKYTDNDTAPEGGHTSGSGTVGASAEGGGLYIENASTTDGSYASISFRTDTADARIAYQSVGSGLNNEGQMSFFLDTNDTDGGSPDAVYTLEEVLRLRGGSSDSDSNQAFNSAYINGRLGVGIASPDDTIHVKGSDGGTALLVEDSGTNSNPAVEIKNDAAHWKIQNRGGDSDKLRIVEGSNVHMVIQQNNGNVGIGDSTPSHKLDVDGTVKGTDVRAATSLGFDTYQMRGTDGVIMQKQATNGTLGAILGTKSPGNFQAGFEFDQSWLTSVNTSDGVNDWNTGAGLTVLTINVGNTGGTNHADVFHGGTITLSISINKDNSDHHTLDSIWSQTVNFVALGGGNFNANTKVDFSIENTLGRKGDETEGNDMFDIAFAVEQISSKYYLVMNVKNATGATLDRNDTGLLITGSLNLLKGQAHTG